eukprot:5773833-Pyramimonas_sp.AAC.1
MWYLCALGGIQGASGLLGDARLCRVRTDVGGSLWLLSRRAEEGAHCAKDRVQDVALDGDATLACPCALQL